MTARLLAFLLLLAPATAQAAERRCGWLDNPTPSNWWLTDRHGEWIISVQGGYQAEGMENIPDMTGRGWVRTNGNYGHGCACMTVDANRRTRRIARIHTVTALPIRKCSADRTLPRR